MSFRKTLASPLFSAVLSGILLALSFPPFSLGFLAWFAFVPLFYAVSKAASRKDAFLQGYFAGLIFFVISFDGLWFVTAIGWIVLSAVEALFLGAFALILFELRPSKSSWFLSVLITCLGWVALEFFRANLPLYKLGWNLLAYSQAFYPLIIQAANTFGTYSLSFVIILANLALASLLIRKNGTSRNIFLPFTILTIVFALIFSHGYYHQKQTGKKIGDLRIALIQGNIPQSVKWELIARDKILEIYTTLTQLAGYDEPSLIIWPEAAFPGYFNRDYAADGIRKLIEKIGASALIGTTLLETDDIAYNSALLVGPDGKDHGRYDKLHLVPFGEYMPMKWAFKGLKPFAESLGISDFTPGKEKTVFRIFNNEMAFSTLICFEDTFPELAREFVGLGAQFLVVITNDAWFHKSGAAAQHLQASIFRAVENGVPVVRAGNTGISAFISNRGEILGQIEDEKGNPLFVTGRKTMALPVEIKDTIYRKGGWVFPYVASAGFVIIVLLTMVKGKSKKEKINGNS